MKKRITLEGFKDATLSVTISNDGVEIMTNRGNKIDTICFCIGTNGVR